MNAITTKTEPVAVMEYTPDQMHDQVQRVQHLMERVMKEGEHFGKVPGCGDKPALLKAGAEKLCFAFRMAPTYDITLTPLTGGHREYQIVCRLRHIVTNELMGEGVGCCSTMESKYRYRGAKSNDEPTEVQVPKAYWDRKREGASGPELQAILSKAVGEPGKYGTKKIDEVWTITRKGESTGDKVENPDIADTFNTVLKMAKKRAHVDAALTVFAASDIFAQDIEENPELYGGRSEAPAAPAQEANAAPATETITDTIISVKQSTDPARSQWFAVETAQNGLFVTDNADLVTKAKGHNGTGETMILEFVPFGSKSFRLTALAIKEFTA